MFIRQSSNGNWYVCRKTYTGKNPTSKGTKRDWWLVKHSTHAPYIFHMTNSGGIYCPESFIGKRVRLKVEVIE